MKLTWLNRVGLLFFISGVVGFFVGNKDATMIWLLFEVIGGISFVQDVI